MRNRGCNGRKLRVHARRRNFDFSLLQRFLKMGASTADCIWQIAKSIPELLDYSLTMTTIRLVTPFTAESTAPEVVAAATRAAVAPSSRAGRQAWHWDCEARSRKTAVDANNLTID